MRLDDLIGQTTAAAVLRNAILRDRVAHAYLFHGPDSVGKSTAASVFAQSLNCEGERPNGPGAACGECRSCTLIAKGSHPDVRLIAPSTGSDAAVIPIERIRHELVYDVDLRPVVGRHKIYLLDPADRTAPLAIHTILKVLEEPPPYVVVILVTSRPALLPPTILSRCQHVAFQLAGADAVEQHLLTLGVDPPAAASLARLSGGRIAWAIRAAQRPEVLSTRKALLDLCATVQLRAAPDALRLAEDIKMQALTLVRARRDVDAETDLEEAPEEPTHVAFGAGYRALRAELPECLDVMVSWYRDCLAASQGGTLLNPDYESVLRGKAGSRGSSQDVRAIEAILHARQAIQRNANLDLTLESLAVELLTGGGQPISQRQYRRGQRT